MHYRVFRLGPDLEAPPLIDESVPAYLGMHEPPTLGSIALDDALVEYTVGSLDPGVHNREAVRHYQINHGDVRRIDPLALSPRDFVDEWLGTDWRQAAFWSEGANRPSSRDWHTRLHKEGGIVFLGEFIYPTMHCTSTPDTWQVGIDFSSQVAEAKDRGPSGVYFLVRWTPPYTFRLVQVSEKPSPGCTEGDRALDDTRRTLFPVQEWR